MRTKTYLESAPATHANVCAGQRADERASERGAALITTLLVSMLLLSAGFVLVLTTAMSATNTVDATAEMQAYYGAEAGLQATLNVLRNRVPPSVPLPNPLPSPDLINLRAAVDPLLSNKPGDSLTTATPPVSRLSRWLNYSATYPDRVVLDPLYGPYRSAAYSVSLSDPDDPMGVIRASNVDYLPSRLLVTVNGYGPRGAQKQLQMIVTSQTLDFNALAMMALIGASNPGDKMVFTMGNSATHSYSGQDKSNLLSSPLFSFAVTNPPDKTIADTMISNLSTNKSGTVNAPGVTLVTDPNSLPWYLRTADDARLFLDIWRDKAANSDQGQYYPANPSGGYAFSGVAGSNPHSFTFVDGDCDLDGGQGLLIVTGELVTKGNVSFSGLILVMGKGVVSRSGGGNGEIYGALAIASFGATGGFTHPTFTMNGGGKMTMQYDKTAVESARTIGKDTLGIVEN